MNIALGVYLVVSLLIGKYPAFIYHTLSPTLFPCVDSAFPVSSAMPLTPNRILLKCRYPGYIAVTMVTQRECVTPPPLFYRYLQSRPHLNEFNSVNLASAVNRRHLARTDDKHQAVLLRVTNGVESLHLDNIKGFWLRANPGLSPRLESCGRR